MRRWILKPKDDLHELFKRMVFNALISNEDDHPRNHGFLYNTKSYRISMVYDLVPRSSTGTSRYSAMTIELDGRVFAKNNLISQCESFDLSKAEAEELFKEMKEKVKGPNFRWTIIFLYNIMFKFFD